MNDWCLIAYAAANWLLREVDYERFFFLQTTTFHLKLLFMSTRDMYIFKNKYSNVLLIWIKKGDFQDGFLCQYFYFTVSFFPVLSLTRLLLSGLKVRRDSTWQSSFPSLDIWDAASLSIVITRLSAAKRIPHCFVMCKLLWEVASATRRVKALRLLRRVDAVRPPSGAGLCSSCDPIAYTCYT